jgi:hypothetical protein
MLLFNSQIVALLLNEGEISSAPACRSVQWAKTGGRFSYRRPHDSMRIGLAVEDLCLLKEITGSKFYRQELETEIDALQNILYHVEEN